MTSTNRQWKRRNRIGIISTIKIILESGEWSGAGEAEKNLQPMEKTFYDLENAYVCQAIVNTTDLILKQMFDISTRLMSEQKEISGLETIDWENHSWKYLSFICDERIINHQCTRVYVFSDSVLCLGKIHDNPQSNDAWEHKLGWIKSSQKLQKLWKIRWWADRIRVKYFPRMQYVAAQWRSQKFALQMGRNIRKFYMSHSLVTVLNKSGTLFRWERLSNFPRIQKHLLNQFPKSIHWSNDRWKAPPPPPTRPSLAAGGGVKRIFQYCTDDSGTIVYFRALPGHSGRNLIDLSIQQNGVIPSNFFPAFFYILDVRSIFTLSSTLDNIWRLHWRLKFDQETNTIFLFVDPMDKSHKDPKVIDLNAPRHAHFLHNSWKRHQDAVFLSRHQSCCWEKDWRCR